MKWAAAILAGATLGAAAFSPAAAQPPAAVPQAPIRLELPAPTGRHAIGVTDLHLVDGGRADPFVAGRPRELMVGVWYPARPAHGPAMAPYMTPGAARAMAEVLIKPLGRDPARVDFSALRTHAAADAPALISRSRFPVILYSHGGNQVRGLGTTLIEELASRGYVVVAIDHTYEAAAVEFPDGRVARTSVPRTGDALRRMIDARLADTRFVLDELARLPSRRGAPRGLARAMDSSRIGMFGHSAGGFTAFEAMRQDRRLDAAANLDGSLIFSVSRGEYPPVVEQGLDRPFMLMGAGVVGRERKLHNHAESIDWRRLWERSTSWKKDVYFPASEHMSFADHQALLPQVAQQLGVPPLVVGNALGEADPARALAAQRAYLAAFFDLHLKGQRQTLFDQPLPDVTIID